METGPMQMKDLDRQMAVAIINHNTCDQLHACLQSIFLETVAVHKKGMVIVVDNASTDGSVAMLRDEFPWVTVQANEDNPGYGTAANQAIRLVSASWMAKYVLLLNSDTRLMPFTLQALVDYLEGNPRVAIAGPLLLGLDGKLQNSCFSYPDLLNTLLTQTSLGKVAGLVPLIKERFQPDCSDQQARAVPWLLGAALAIRREAFAAIGGFDESFFMYSEEVDLCYRLAQAGWQIHFVPQAAMIHVGGASTRRYRKEMEVLRYASTRLFYRKHYSRWSMLLLRLFVTYTMFRNTARDSARLGGWWSEEQPDGNCRERIKEDIDLWSKVLTDTWRVPARETQRMVERRP